MNIFGQLYSIMFGVGLILFLCNPLGFIRESERVVMAPGPKIINGHFGIPKRARQQRKVSRADDYLAPLAVHGNCSPRVCRFVRAVK